MSAARAWLCATILGLSLVACRGPDSVEAALARGSVVQALAVYDALPRADPERLVPIAERLLSDAAQSEDAGLVARAFSELATAGTHARRVLEALAEADALRVRARALGTLARLGDTAAQQQLQPLLRGATPELRALALGAQREPDAAFVRAALGAPHASVREAAVHAARRVSMDAPLEALLAELLRRDPEPSVRAGAAAALGRGGDPAVRALDAALADASSAVRQAALGALWSVAPARAALRVHRLWATDPTDESLEAARRALDASAAAALASDAREHLVRALTASAPALRAQAALGLGGAGAAAADALAARLAIEQVPTVQLALAVALGPARTAATLRTLAAGQDVNAAQAAAALAAYGEQVGLERLRLLRASPAVAVRRVTYVALARELGRVSEARGGLSDPDPHVRLATAGAVLTGRARPVRPRGSS